VAAAIVLFFVITELADQLLRFIDASGVAVKTAKRRKPGRRDLHTEHNAQKKQHYSGQNNLRFAALPTLQFLKMLFDHGLASCLMMFSLPGIFVYLASQRNPA
jgi:hypothetical protein